MASKEPTIRQHSQSVVVIEVEGTHIPLGVQVVGRRGEDAHLLNVAEAIEGATTGNGLRLPQLPTADDSGVGVFW